MPRHNRRDEPHRYTVQVQKADYPTLERLLRTGRLVPLERPAHEPDDHIKGVASRNTYRLAPGSEIDIVQDQAILIDGQTVHASAYRLPTWAYAALRQQSSRFLQYAGMDELLARLRVQPFTDRLVRKFDLPVEGWRASSSADEAYSPEEDALHQPMDTSADTSTDGGSRPDSSGGTA